MKKKKKPNSKYYHTKGILSEIIDGDVPISLDEALKQDILAGKRKRKLRNITIKLIPLYLVSAEYATKRRTSKRA